MDDPALKRALAAAGGVAALARAVGVTPGAVSQWTRVPPARLAAVARATGLPVEALDPTRTEALLAEARALGLDPGADHDPATLPAAIGAEKARRWQEENRDAIAAWNRWTEANELPLARYRMF